MGCCGVKMLAVHSRLDERDSSDGTSPDGKAKKQVSTRPDTDLILEASERISSGGLKAVFQGFVSPTPRTTTSRPLEERGLSIDALTHFMTAFALLEARMLVVLHVIRILTQGTGRSLAELLEGKCWGSGETGVSSDGGGKGLGSVPGSPRGSEKGMAAELEEEGLGYLGSVNFFVSYTLEDRMEDCLDAIRRHEQSLHARRKKSSAHDRQYYYFLSAFSLDQSNVMGRELNFPDLNRVLAAAESTLLVCHPWHNPTLISRMTCLYEMTQTLAVESKLEV
jgi:hypothetical protein